ncbi:hypothetical protein Q3W71_01235 [Micromonospora sp. C28SCA-DRY-2]|uniref:competence protein CoiA family protein n=1 Tax=Micromonospora sp. C28SCA-DRY-2 TaxID=3059522 RepID=UPI002675DA2F|nr:hypothetical protein [Micromonospora sp. C28SCA-DRY-2]MDO3700303.1 hypothetical protein [Micromonospora sp. C28SCA-DRY-2]
MRHQAQKGLPRAPVWLTFVEGRYGPTFRHEDGRSPHPEHQPESDTHKALKERKARTWMSVGGTVEVEVWRPRARRRPDVVAVGPVLTVAGEIQHSKETPRTIRARQRALHKAGDRVVWTTDRGADDITFLRPVPHLSVPALSDHRLYLTEPRLEIGAGAIMFETQRVRVGGPLDRNEPLPGHPQGRTMRPLAPLPDVQPPQLQPPEGRHDPL